MKTKIEPQYNFKGGLQKFDRTTTTYATQPVAAA